MSYICHTYVIQNSIVYYIPILSIIENFDSLIVVYILDLFRKMSGISWVCTQKYL